MGFARNLQKKKGRPFERPSRLRGRKDENRPPLKQADAPHGIREAAVARKALLAQVLLPIGAVVAGLTVKG